MTRGNPLEPPAKRLHKDTRKRIGDRHKPGYYTAYKRLWRARKKLEAEEAKK